MWLFYLFLLAGYLMLLWGAVQSVLAGEFDVFTLCLCTSPILLVVALFVRIGLESSHSSGGSDTFDSSPGTGRS